MALTTTKKLAFAALVPLPLLAVAELALRAARVNPALAADAPIEFWGVDPEGPLRAVPDADRFWRLVPGARVPNAGDRLNAEGFRGDDWKEPKAAGEKRVLVIGDSNAFGVSVERDATFAHRLERWLGTAPGARWEVRNAGVPGYSAWQAWRVLAAEGPRVRPDVVVAYVGAWNDFAPAIDFDDETNAARLRAPAPSGARAAVDGLRLLRVLRAPFAARRGDAEGSKRKRYYDAYAERGERPDGPRLKPESFRRILEWIARDAKALGARVVFVVPAAPASTRARFADSDVYATIVREAGASAADAGVDARAAIERDEAQGETRFLDVIHPTERGHATIARGVAEALAALPIAPLPALKPQLFGASQPLAEKTFAIPVPGSRRFDGVRVPDGAALIVTTSASGSAPVRLAIRAEEDGSAPRELFADDVTPPREGWSEPRRRRIDLAALAGRSVSLTFETSGSGGDTLWGAATIEALR